MPEHSIPDETRSYWYVMHHSKPDIIDARLKEVNKERERLHFPRIDYIIPSLHLNKVTRQQTETENQTEAKPKVRRKVKTDDIELNNSLCNYLHYFVFVKASNINELYALVHQDWNRQRLFHLAFRFTHSGQPLRMTEAEMQQLMAIVAEYHYKYGFRKYDVDAMSRMTVRLRKGSFKGRSATVIEVIRDDSGIHLTLGIPVFNDEFVMELYDIPLEDIEMTGGEISTALEPFLVGEMEKTLIGILRCRVRRQLTDAIQREQKQKLDLYSRMFQVLRFEDETSQAHLRALQLLNASLRGDASMKARLVKELERTILASNLPTTDEEAFSLAILFVATRKGPYRKAVKTYSQTHTVILSSLTNILPVIKDLNTR